MLRFILNIALSALAVMLCAWLLPGVSVTGFWIAVVVVAILALLNAFVKPVLILLTIPLTVFTLGLFLLVINAVIIMLTDWLIPGFVVRNFWWALLFSLILSIVNSLIDTFIPRSKS
ncbi:MAG: phage holin family protein [Bacteroidia bacterium]